MNALIMKKRILALCLGACFALSAHAQQNLEWIKEMPPSAPPAGRIMVPEMDAPQARPVDPKYRAKIHTERAAA